MVEYPTYSDCVTHGFAGADTFYDPVKKIWRVKVDYLSKNYSPTLYHSVMVAMRIRGFKLVDQTLNVRRFKIENPKKFITITFFRNIEGRAFYNTISVNFNGDHFETMTLSEVMAGLQNIKPKKELVEEYMEKMQLAKKNFKRNLLSGKMNEVQTIDGDLPPTKSEH